MSFTVIFLIVVIGAVLLRLINQTAKKTPPSSLPVAAKKYFFSRAEREFYETLKQALPIGYVAFPNVRLQDIFFITAKGDQRRGVYGFKLAKVEIFARSYEGLMSDPARRRWADVRSYSS